MVTMDKQRDSDVSDMIFKADATHTINNESSPSKRKASPSPSQASSPKRPRHPDPRTASSNQEEKRRNKRLFGGLISTLSQTNRSTPAQQRRQEIEQRQKERLQRQGAEVEAERQKKGERLLQERRDKEILWEEEVMKRRHERMRVEAGSLATKARPKIFYLPRRLTRREKDEIQRRRRDVERQIAGEERRFELRKRRHVESHGDQVSGSATHRDGDGQRFSESMEGERRPHGAELDSMHGDTKRIENDTVKQDVFVAKADKEKQLEHHTGPNDIVQSLHDQQDDSGDEIVTTEDMVIY